MNARETLGLILIVIGLVLTPVALMFSHLLVAVSMIVIIFGAFLFYTERMIKREEKLEKESGGCIPHSRTTGDVHNYSGRANGGRSDTADDSIDFGADD